MVSTPLVYVAPSIGSFNNSTGLLVLRSTLSILRLQSLNDGLRESIKKVSALSNSELIGIDSSAFNGCKHLVEVDLSRAPLEYIKDDAFFGCQSLNTVKLSSSLQTIGNGAFKSCTNLQNLILGANSNLREINSNAFSFCPLSTFKFSALFHLERIGSSAFEYSNISEFVTKSKVKYIDSLAFFNCKRLSMIRLRDYTNVGVNAFTGTSIKCHQDIKGSQKWKTGLVKKSGVPEEALSKCITVNNVLRDALWYDESSSDYLESEEETSTIEEVTSTPDDEVRSSHEAENESSDAETTENESTNCESSTQSTETSESEESTSTSIDNNGNANSAPKALSPGAVAGISIGCIAFAAVAVVAVFYVVRKSNSHKIVQEENNEITNNDSMDNNNDIHEADKDSSLL